MAWQSKVNATQLTSITGTEQFFNQKISLGLGDKVHLQIKCIHGSGVSDPLVVALYSTLDASSETWDTIPSPTIFGVTNPTLIYPADPNPIISLVVEGPYKFRIGVRAGSGGTITSADLSYRIALTDIL